jgi:hypothetical protein
MSQITAKEAMDKWNKICLDPFNFIKRLKIVAKDGKLINLILNREQIKIIEALISGEDCLVLKGRQIGSSTAIAAYYFWKIYTSVEPVKFAILSHKLASSKELFKMHKIFYDNLPKMFQKPLDVYNTTEMKFATSGASIIAASAGAEGGLRSFTCSYLQLSEYAFAPNPEELKATALNALNDGQFIMESTANYFNDALHQEIMKCEKGEADWKYLFFPWFSHEAYQEDVTEELIFGEEEDSLVKLYNLTKSQVKWRRSKIAKIGQEKFKREFPANIDDAYAVTGNVYLPQSLFKLCNIVSCEPKEYTFFADPLPNDQYAIGVDVSAGVMRDYSVIYIVSKMSYQATAIYRSNKTSPTNLAHIIQSLAIKYNSALVLVESNNYGNVVLNELRHLGYNNIWLQDGKDWQTTSSSKTEMFENLKETLERGYVTSLDNITYSELRALQVSNKGAIELPENLDSHADSAVAMALAYVALHSVKLKAVEYLPAWIKSGKASKTIQHNGVNLAGKRRY